MENALKTWVIPLTVIALSVVALLYMLAGLDEDNIRGYIRVTAGSSLCLFALAWSSSSLNTLLSGHVWRPVLRARRRFGIAFAVSHTFHLLGIIALYELALGGDWSDSELPPGLVLYAVIYAMAFTSNDASVRALGRHWKRLHVAGGLAIWGAFTLSYIGKISEYGFLQHYLFAGLCVLLPVLRILAWRARRRVNP